MTLSQPSTNLFQPSLSFSRRSLQRFSARRLFPIASGDFRALWALAALQAPAKDSRQAVLPSALARAARCGQTVAALSPPRDCGVELRCHPEISQALAVGSRHGETFAVFLDHSAYLRRAIQFKLCFEFLLIEGCARRARLLWVLGASPRERCPWREPLRKKPAEIISFLGVPGSELLSAERDVSASPARNALSKSQATSAGFK